MKPELILLHGWGFDSKIWTTFIPYLENHFKITALDLLGFGNNKTTDPLTLKSIAENVLANAPQSAVFLGWSLGGLIAMYIAIHYPERITQLITIASTPKFVAENSWPGMLPAVLEKFSDGLKMDYQATLQQFILLQFQGSETDRQLVRSLRQQAINDNAPSEQTLNDGLMILKNTDLRNALNQIQCPQLYLFGRCDMLVPAGVAEKLKSLTTSAEMELLAKVSHAPFLSNPTLCAEKIENFIR